MRKSVIIVAGGSGTRMGSELPKQFLLLENRPVLMWTIECFIAYDAGMEIMVVLPEDHIPFWKQLCDNYNFRHPHRVIGGGTTRFQSVRNGLLALTATGLVAVHDGVRPLVSHATIGRCFAQAAISGAAIPVLHQNESLRRGTMKNSVAVDRKLFYVVQTPQVFERRMLEEAYHQAPDDAFTDDASVVERQGGAVTMVPGNPENIKITHPVDLWVASAYLKKRKDTI